MWNKGVFEMKTLNLVIPMAGLGNRFKEKGFDLPKPLMKIRNKYFFEHSVNALLRYFPSHSLTFIILEEHEAKFEISKKIAHIYEDSTVKVLPELTRGSAETALSALSVIKNIDDPMVVADCDQWISGNSLYKFASDLLLNHNDICLPYFISKNENYSYLRLDTQKYVCEIAEKKVISNFAIAGCYGFSSSSLFLSLYRSTKWGQEHYMSDVIRTGLEHSGKIKGYKLDQHLPFGTPEEYEKILESDELMNCLRNV